MDRIGSVLEEHRPSRAGTPSIKWTLLVALVRTELNARPEFRPVDRDGDLAEHCKGVAARARIAYDSETIRKAIDAVRAARAAKLAKMRRTT